jgi:hypothetical protein
MSVEMDRLRAAYPDGDWAEIILESLGQEIVGDKHEDDERAIAACVKVGMPRETFSNSRKFCEYVDKLQATGNRFAESVTACMTLPPQARVQRAQVLRDKYASLIKVLAAETLIDPVEVGILFSEHEAELTLARLALALSASKSDGKFPDSLQAIEGRFGGSVPANPYTGEAVVYRSSEDGRSFELRIPPQDAFPEVAFNSLPPAEAK